jgi:hypothetical protein
MSATPALDTHAPEQKPADPEDKNEEKTPQERKEEKKPQEPQEESDWEWLTDSEDEFAAYRSDPEDEEPTEREALPEGALPVVRSYQLDLPKGKRARAQFDRDVANILHRIKSSKR